MNHNKLKQYINMLLSDDSMCKQLGENARKTIVDNFSVPAFVKRWNEVFYKAIGRNK